MEPITDQPMDQPKQKVKIPCNHMLLYIHLTQSYSYCAVCNGDYGLCYYCSRCNFQAHSECIEWPDTIDHPSHSRHPLKKVSPGTIDYTDGKCHFCREELVDPMYHCSLCNFSIDVNCWRHPPQRTIYQPKSHEHTFTLMPRKITFTCNACGMLGDCNPYFCFECGFMLHKDCIDLPRVININRHDHRISRTYHLGHGDWGSCGVCRKEIDWSLGAYSCKRCPNYAVHSKCAIREDVWNGEELEDVPEEEEEIEDPYKVVNDKEIIHFCHEEHNLRLGGDDDVTGYEKMLCDACITPISSDPFFKCVQCEFFLHKVCASLPRRKRNIMHTEKLDLQVTKAGEYNKCISCRKIFDGFRYCSRFEKFDVRCGSISEPFHHELHPHPLYHILSAAEKLKLCGACGKYLHYVLSCTVCEFNLGMDCATLPRKVRHICDAHDLSLHHVPGNSKGQQLWCDSCEGKLDPSVWFYGCDDCGSTLHIKCVLGDFNHLKPGKKYGEAELVVNDGMTRPFCISCKKRCSFPSFLKATCPNTLCEQRWGFPSFLKAASPDSFVLFACSMDCAYDKYFMLWFYEVDY
ncbi:putative chromatin regulator PHD family [Arabidopsis thaliana]|uniref:At3g07000 n=4 Tax=Arabidopsis TaxID=3701 RepID=Q9M8Z9_ARATH|nr:Cysteine/Histidine-rich C1 domain family protein [Arabidopsis thaliana]KAG7624340.1 Zinc finger PHD-type [Arabidopsis thaliana x Arabidopsis arenosa]KAG7630354.1 Zinc finger PHD-type [Arabidopsis suecica]AAF27004.1 hypothetical protein [Arabidopsis thaliana]ABO38763.1 At3g07000 [Arabidopsis thaliana]AEE74486.1 Cysteine/Histidine-rich C1 domain family protein [Arabidopsis thaliana]|eukprot:NP_187356.1 Cysteine/Histidine-rich C1 domain family protein [Arabidopsis thaliana]